MNTSVDRILWYFNTLPTTPRIEFINQNLNKCGVHYFGPKVLWQKIFTILAISSRVLFFLSITPFCWGILGAEKLCPIPISSQYLVNDSFSSFVPYSVLIYEMISPLSFRSRRHNFVKEENVSFLWAKNITHVNREKSSTTTSISIKTLYFWWTY